MHKTLKLGFGKIQRHNQLTFHTQGREPEIGLLSKQIIW
jgi:hypothetical protein